jgi:hypothetical protein
VTADELLATARAVAVRGYPRAAALLARQSLEAGLDDFWARREPVVAAVSVRAQLACLFDYLNDTQAAGAIAFNWGALSRACHHQPYEMAPTDAELRERLDSVGVLLERLSRPSSDRPRR